MNAAPRLIPTSYQTRRLFARSTQAGDGPLINAAILDSFSELHPWMPWAKERPRVADSERYAQEAAGKFAAGEGYDFSVFLLDIDGTPGELVVSCGMHALDRPRGSYELGYWCRTAYTGQGYVTEACRGLIAFAARHLRLYHPVVRCDEANAPSRRVAEHLGFLLIARIENEKIDHLGRMRHGLVYARLVTPEALLE